jgi:hypothetical protein
MRGFNAMALPFAIRLSWSAGSVNYIIHSLLPPLLAAYLT